MRALSPTLISILEAALRAGATRAEMDRAAGSVTLVREDHALGAGALPAAAYDLLLDELRGLGARDGARSSATVQSPVGPLELFIELGEVTTRIFFARDAEEAQGEAALSALMSQADALQADRVQCVPEQLAFFRGAELHAVAALDAERLKVLVAHARAIGGIGQGDGVGGAVLLGQGAAPRALRIEVKGDVATFALGRY